MLPLPREFYLDTPEYEQAFALRRSVLLDPFGIETTQAKGDDAEALHLGIFDAERCLATLLLVTLDPHTVKMRQVAVARDVQGQGWGRKLVEHAQVVARDHGFGLMVAHARQSAIPFYVALGYEVVGDTFLQVGLLHRLVRKRLATAS